MAAPRMLFKFGDKHIIGFICCGQLHYNLTARVDKDASIQAHVSRQISGQIPNQAGTQLPGVPQQNGSSLSNQIQHLGGYPNTPNMEPELVKARKFMQEKM
ncbi:hypothetical protein Acr_16g0010480 [Actinidia rufa]|uniref:Uncharacterized protein n=1 Tax=Actinidia rufa TaxID=165716 RepID=A0A7J0G0R6_9ERIC|nr:hypothetical protein Acr_16g0010480 [Actinidia rufa]